MESSEERIVSSSGTKSKPPASVAYSQTESALLYDCRFTANQFVWATSPLTLTTSIFFQMNTCGHSPYVTSSLTRGWVCRSQLLLVLASAVILTVTLSQLLSRVASNDSWSSLYNLGTDGTENTASNIYSIVSRYTAVT
jgi:hypothetical protein